MPEKPGLQIQRTHLSWERTAVSFSAVAGVLLFHQSGRLAWDRTLLAALAMLMCLFVLWVGRVRGGISVGTDASGRPVIRNQQRAIQLIGWGTAIMAAAAVVMVVFG